jgi:hypothetical protein
MNCPSVGGEKRERDICAQDEDSRQPQTCSFCRISAKIVFIQVVGKRGEITELLIRTHETNNNNVIYM